MPAPPAPVVPAYGGPCVDAVVPALLRAEEEPPDWMPSPVVDAEQVVLLVLDGLGWEQLQERTDLAPTLTAMSGGPITTVVPSTTATALTSLTTGTPPAVHGVMGYRVRAGKDVLNVLRWRTSEGDARRSIPPASFSPAEPFAGRKPPVVTRSEFSDSGFSGVHLAGARHYGWKVPSTLVAQVDLLLEAEEPFVYAYYDGVDKVAHEFGLGELYDAEVAAADRLVADVASVLPKGAALVVVSDHGQVDVGDRVLLPAQAVLECIGMMSGESRFRWLHARPGMEARLAEAARAGHDSEAWVATRREAEEAGWFGGPLDGRLARRVGDVVIAPYEPVAVLDPVDAGEVTMRARHGSLTAAEMLVPLLATRA